MDSRRFMGDQQVDEQFKPPEECWSKSVNNSGEEGPFLQQSALPHNSRECCCKGVSNFGELKRMPEFMAYLNSSIEKKVEKVLIQHLKPYVHILQQLALPPNSSSLPYHSKSYMPGCYQLSFKGELPNELLTKNKIEEEGASVEVELLDEFGKRVEVGLDSGVKIKVDVLDGAFDAEDISDWTEEDYKRNIVRPRKDRGPLLKGNSQFSLDGGVAGVYGFSFTDNSTPMRDGNFRFGAQVIGSLPSGRVVRSAVSKKAFKVKENRLKSDRKHSTPFLEDNLWRLKNISKTGVYYSRATKNNIHTVKDFLQLYHTDEKKLKAVLKIPETKWVEIVKNAKECKLTNEHYQYYDDASGNALILDCAFNIKRVIFKGRTTQLYESLDFTQKENAGKLRQSAYEKRNNLEIYDYFTNKVPTQGLEYPSSALQQEEEEQEQQPVAAPPPSNNPSVGSFSQYMVASTSSHIYSYSPVLHPDTTGTYQGTELRNAKQSEFPKISILTNQNFDQDLTNLSVILQQLPSPGSNYNGSGFENTLDASSFAMGNIPPTNVYHDAAGASQAYQGSTNCFLQNGDDEQLVNEEDDDWLKRLMNESPPQEDRRNVTRKLISVYYMTKAATMFMISVQQDANVPKKKPKLQ